MLIEWMNDKIEAAKHFGIHNWHPIKHAAMRLVMGELSKKPEYWDYKLISKVVDKWKIGDCVGFYSHRPELWW